MNIDTNNKSIFKYPDDVKNTLKNNIKYYDINNGRITNYGYHKLMIHFSIEYSFSSLPVIFRFKANMHLEQQLNTPEKKEIYSDIIYSEITNLLKTIKNDV